MIRIYIICKLKNTIITVTLKNKVLFQISTETFSTDLKTKYKNNPFVLRRMSKYLYKKLFRLNFYKISIYFKGIGPGRYNIVKFLNKRTLTICHIKDISFIPFNGCRPKKLKRK